MKVKGFINAVKLTVQGSPVQVPLGRGSGVLLYNDGAGKVFVGPADVNTDTGVPIEPNTGMFIELKEGARIYVVSDSTASLRVLEVV